MHPSFSNLFVHPKTHKPLNFFGNVENDRWTNCFLWTYEQEEMYPIVDSIPIFVLPHDLSQSKETLEEIGQTESEKTWKPGEAPWKMGERWVKEGSKLAEFARSMAESDGLILDVASGPGGGFVPPILHINPNAKILMNDLSMGILQEWQKFLRKKGIPSISFAVFDARKIPLRTSSIDIVSDLGGFDNIQESVKAVKETYRILRSSGALFSLNSTVEREDFLKLPEEVRTRWYSANPPLFEGLLETFQQVGFKVINHIFLGARELSPDEGDLPRKADKYGVRLHINQYCTHLTK